MAIPGVKYDDGGVGVPGNCFPVRSIFKQSEEGGGAWLVSLRAEQRRRFKAVLCSKPKTYSQIKEEKKQSAAPISTPRLQGNLSDEEEGETLDGFYLMKHSCVEDPSDLCSVNICGKGITEVKEEDLGLFDNVAYVNAGENFLPFEAFRGFPIIRELEIPLNGLRGIRITRKDFPHMEVLDLSYNNLAKEDILMLGVIPKLRVLHLTGNNFKELPPDLAQPFKSEKEKRMERFPALEILFLDDNKLSDLSTFSALAGLRRLRHLSLEKNNIFSVPQLRLVGGRLITQESPAFKKMKKSKTPKSRPLSARSQRKMEEEDRDDQPRPPKETQKPEKQRKKKTVPGHYKGYEILLDVPEDPNTHIPKDLQGSVRALKQMLDHPIVFRDNVVQLDRIQKPFEPYKQHKYLSDVPPKTYQEKVDDMLTEMKTRTAVTEAPLNVALKDKRKMKDFPEAPTLLGDVQRKYNAVRTASMHDAREARKALKSTLDEVSKKNQK
ncbi:X-ray radiation resistance-associated protein 1-like [Lingula anatina]|uniref:X-ray radiation resistance-associated protein 1-like n=1 Tax=Lingula anatina TaxID=7574 RepID=A0A2R2MPY6_LINAN|nr:X-ray radiation resistance-associated protein 1-like [Lingula anatina]|eukprot:XP_023932305.1 X-ray radiation resistance-associated protein 1-like [Lingula anatina]